MCDTAYFSHEEVQAVVADLTNDNNKAANAKLSENVDTLIAPLLPTFGSAALLTGQGDPITSIRVAFTIGAVVGLKLSGTADSVNPNQEYAPEFQNELNSVQETINALQYQEAATHAATA